MKNKFILTVILSVLLVAGCAHERIVYRDTPKPVYIVPAPPAVQRPVLATENLTPEQRADPGIVLQAEHAAVEQLHGYIDQLEAVIKKYSDLATISADNLRRLMSEAAGTGGTTEQPRSLNSATVDEWHNILEPKVSEEDKSKKVND